MTEDALRKAKVGLVASLNHPFESCNPGYADRCFVCEGLRAVMEALGEVES